MIALSGREIPTQSWTQLRELQRLQGNRADYRTATSTQPTKNRSELAPSSGFASRDTSHISDDAQRLLEHRPVEQPEQGRGVDGGMENSVDGKDESVDAAKVSRADTQADSEVVEQLKARDREVRAHERAHQAAAGALARGLSYKYEMGPDGRMYAVGGEVDIDMSEVSGDPRATLRKAEKIRRAALAPAEPSAQDVRVASSAQQMIVEAQAEIQQLMRQEQQPQVSASTETETGSEAKSDSPERAAQSTGDADQQMPPEQRADSTESRAIAAYRRMSTASHVSPMRCCFMCDSQSQSRHS